LEEVTGKAHRDLEECEEGRRQELFEFQQNFEKKYNRFKEYQIDIEKLIMNFKFSCNKLEVR